MSKGYPDFFGQSSYFQYGPLTLEKTMTTVDNGDVGYKQTITDRAMIEKCFIEASDGDDGEDFTLRFYIDGALLVNLNVPSDMQEGWLHGSNYLLQILYADYAGKDYALLLTGNILFTASFKVYATTGSASDVSLYIETHYRKVLQL